MYPEVVQLGTNQKGAWNLRGRAQGLVGFDLCYAACPLPDRWLVLICVWTACPFLTTVHV